MVGSEKDVPAASLHRMAGSKSASSDNGIQLSRAVSKSPQMSLELEESEDPSHWILYSFNSYHTT
jgi:hypothetical protein